MFDETDKYRVISHQLGSSLTDKYQLRLSEILQGLEHLAEADL